MKSPIHSLAISVLLAPTAVIAAPAAQPATEVEQQIIDTIDIFNAYCSIVRELNSGRFTPAEQVDMLRELAAEAEDVVSRRARFTPKEKEALARLKAQPIIAHLLSEMHQQSRSISYNIFDMGAIEDLKGPVNVAHTRAAKSLNKIGLLIIHEEE